MNDNEDYLTPLVGAIIGGVITLAIAYVGTKLMTRYVDRRLKVLNAK